MLSIITLRLCILPTLFLPYESVPHNDGSKAWFKRTPASVNATCSCRYISGLECTASGIPRDGKRPFLCSEVGSGTSTLKIQCLGSRSEIEVNLDGVLQHFSGLSNLTIDGCRVSKSHLFLEESPNVTHTSRIGWKEQTEADVAIYTDFRIDWPRLPSSLPDCSLINLSIKHSRLLRLPINILRQCKNLRSIELDSNDMPRIDSDGFVALIEMAFLRKLKLSNNFINVLGGVPEAVISSILKALADNFTEWIDENIDDKTIKLKWKTVARKFEGWKPDAFPLTIHRLIRDVSEMNMSFLFGKLRLDTLNLDDNKYETIPRELFLLPGLRHLSMNRNRLKTIFNEDLSKRFYCSRSTLQTLSLAENNMTYIDFMSLRYLSHVRFLNASHNKIHYISPNFIPSDNRLGLLDLSHNRLKYFRVNVKLSHLYQLNLSYNFLTSLDESLTQSLVRIELLSLANNKIKSFGLFSLKYLNLLQYIDLRNNSFSTMPALAFRTSRRQTRTRRVTVDIRDNNQTLFCDCRSVFSTIRAEKLFVDGKYKYPHVITDPHKVCYENEVDKSMPRDPFDDRVFYCYTRIIMCAPDNCTCCQDSFALDCPCRWHCPKGCLCYQTFYHTIRVINCANASLNKVPRITTVNATILRLDGNNLRTISNRFQMNLATVKKLYLNSSRIEFLHEMSLNSFKSLTFLNLTDNLIKTIPVNVFSGLKKLSRLYLSHNQISKPSLKALQGLQRLDVLSLKDNPVTCDCDNIPEFFKGISEQAMSGKMYVDAPTHCLVNPTFAYESGVHDDSLTRGRLLEVCKQVRDAREKAQRQASWRLHIFVGVGVSLSVAVILLVFGSHYRYSVLVHTDRLLQSQFARASLGRLLHLPGYHQRPFDVGFLVHECQSQHYYEMRRRLRATERRDLRTFRIAQHMPGAMRLSQTESLMDQMALCVVLVSDDFLDDPTFVQELHVVLSTNLRSRGGRLDVLPILLAASVKEHAEWPTFRLLLRAYTTLVWKMPFFWERFVVSLPPPPLHRNLKSTTAMEEYEPLLGSAEASDAPQLCIISHENQVSNHVRQLYDRYRSQADMCHVRHGRIYGPVQGLSYEGSASLDKVIGCCTQVVAIVSLEFLDDAWTRDQVVPSLMARFATLPYPGSVILVDAGVGICQLCSRQEYNFFAGLRDHSLAITLNWNDIRRNWASLDRHLLTAETQSFEPHALTTSMDEAQYERSLMQPTDSLLHDARADGEGESYHIFEQNMAAIERQYLH